MSYPQARIDLSVNAQGAINGTRQAVQAFNQLEQKGKQAVATLDTGINQTTNSMARLESQTTKTTASFQRNGMAMLAIGTSYAGAYTAISNLDKAMQRVSKAELGLQRARDLEQTTLISIQRLESQLNKLRSEGKTNTDTYTLALAKLELQQQKLGTATNDLKVKEEELRIQQGALTDTQILFATMMINTVVSSIALGRQAVEGLSVAQVKNRIQTALTTKTYYANAIGLKTMGTASIFSISGLKGLMTTQKLLNISMGKWLLIATGVILAYEGIAHVIKMLNPEVDITIEKLSGDLFSAMDKAQMKAMGMSDEVIATTETMTEFGTTVDQTGESVVQLGNLTSETAGKITGLATGFGETSQAILRFHEELSGKGLEDVQNRVDAINMVFEALGSNIDKNSEEWKRAVHSLIPEIGKLADELAISSKDGALAFVNNMKKMTGDTNGELDKIIKKINEVDSALSETSKKKRQIDDSADLDDFTKTLEANRNLGFIKSLYAVAEQAYKRGDIGTAIAYEKYASYLGRNQTNVSGTIRSIDQQLSSIKSILGTTTIKNLGGQVGNVTGLNFQDLLNRGVQNNSYSVTNAMLKATGMTSAGYISAKLSGVKNPKAIGMGGSQSKGRTNRGMGAGRSRQLSINSANAQYSADLQAMTGFALKDLEALTGLTLQYVDYNTLFLANPRSNRINYEDYTTNRAKLVNQYIRQEAENRAEISNRISLINEIYSLNPFSSISIAQSASALRSVLTQTKSQISQASSTLGLTQEQIITSQSSQLTRYDIQNMITFSQLERNTMNQV